MNNQNNEDNSTMDIFEYVVKPHENSAKRNFNNSKSNKNMINLWGVAILGTLFITIGYFTIASRFGYGMSFATSLEPIFLIQCCSPVLLPAMYFMCKPKNLISVLKDLNFL